MSLNPRTLLQGVDFIHSNAKIFTDKEGLTGLCIDGKFSDLEDMRQLCREFEVYIYNIREYKTGYTICYGCREKETSEQIRKKTETLPAWNPRIVKKTNESLFHKRLARPS